MNHNKLSALSLVCFTLWQSYAAGFTLKELTSLFGKKECTGVQHQKDLSLEKFVGVWFPSYQVNPILSSSPPCQTFEIELIGPGTLNISYYSRILSGIVMRAGSIGKISKAGEPAVMSWQWDFVPDTPETTVVAETDYDNYAVLITCSPLGLPTTGFVLSRDEKIGESFLQTGKEVMGKYLDSSTGRLMQTAVCDLNPVGPNEKIIQFNSFQVQSLFKEIFAK